MSIRCVSLLVAFAWVGWERMLPAQNAPMIHVLGIAQDGGYPQAGCQKDCCRLAWAKPEKRCSVSCLAIVDPVSHQRWLLDCTPDFPEQLHLLDKLAPSEAGKPITGIFPTHAHIGHYAGLIHLGREVMGAQKTPVHCMPRMKYFLETNGPWSQLVQQNQIQIKRLSAGSKIQLNHRIAITAIPVPHRDEFSETVAFRIDGPDRSALYLPDIDKWDRWHIKIEELVQQVDLAFLDATFFDDQELPGRDMSQIPHPFITETIERFLSLPEAERAKVHLIHLNHTNPALNEISEAYRKIHASGLKVAKQGNSHTL